MTIKNGWSDDVDPGREVNPVAEWLGAVVALLLVAVVAVAGWYVLGGW